MVWNSYPNCGQMCVKKRTKARSIHVHKFDIIALNECFWVIWHSWSEKMFKTVKFCENCFVTRNSYLNRVGVSWGSPTPLNIAKLESWPIKRSSRKVGKVWRMQLYQHHGCFTATLAKSGYSASLLEVIHSITWIATIYMEIWHHHKE